MVSRSIGLVRHARGRDVELTSDDRLHAGLPGLGVELRDTEKIAVVRDGQGRHLLLSRTGYQSLNSGGPIKQGILGVAVEVTEICHMRGGVGRLGPGRLRVQSRSESCANGQERRGVHPGQPMWISSGHSKTAPDMIPLRLVVIGRKLTEDLLFWEHLGRSITATAEAPIVLVHGPGEMTARSLEGDGLSLDDVGRDESTDAAILAAFRNENRRAATILTDQGVPAVGFLGTDRKMISGDLNGPAVRAGLISQTASTGAVPLLGAVAHGPSGLFIPALATVVEGWIGTAEASSAVIWLTGRSPESPISPEDVMNQSGETRLPERVKMEGVSVRVSGISDVGSLHPEVGVAMPPG